MSVGLLKVNSGNRRDHEVVLGKRPEMLSERVQNNGRRKAVPVEKRGTIPVSCSDNTILFQWFAGDWASASSAVSCYASVVDSCLSSSHILTARLGGLMRKAWQGHEDHAVLPLQWDSILDRCIQHQLSGCHIDMAALMPGDWIGLH